MPDKYDVIIVGAGPGGISAALELTERDNLDILMIEKGHDAKKRKCPVSRHSCISCDVCSITGGWGGAGAYSDGKLTLSSEIGGWLLEYISRKRADQLIDYVDRVFLQFGAPEEVYGTDPEKIGDIAHRATMAGMTLVPGKVRHLGTEICSDITKSLRRYLGRMVEIKTDTEVTGVTVRGKMITGVKTGDGCEYKSRYVILAPGRSGAAWMLEQARAIGLTTTDSAVDIGLRVEVPAPIMEPLTRDLYEPKIVYYSSSFEDRVRTFCVNPYGEVIVEKYEDVLTVNGHSFREQRTENTNFALLISTKFTEPFKEPIAYGKYIARLANLLGEGIILQRLGDLEIGRRSTPRRIARSTVSPTLEWATPGDLSFVLPYRYISDILEMLKALDTLAPGLYSRNTLLYGVEVKFYSSVIKLTPGMETQLQNLFGVGDGVGVSRGLVHAAASGVLAARSILRKERKRKKR